MLMKCAPNKHCYAHMSLCSISLYFMLDSFIDSSFETSGFVLYEIMIQLFWVSGTNHFEEMCNKYYPVTIRYHKTCI